MRNRLFTLISIILILSLVLTGTALAQRGNGQGNGDRDGKGQNFKGERGNNNCIDISELPKYDLDSNQIEEIKFMFEEEKLARDVYTYLYEKWDHRVFERISRSEQRHMDRIEELLDKYELEVPVNEVGEFNNPELQKLYDSLIEKGSTSLEEAFKVGILIEETDIKDLDEALETSTEDMKVVFDELKRGSEKHLEAFQRNLENGGSGQGYGGKNKKGRGNGNKDGNGKGKNNNKENKSAECLLN